MMAQVTQTLKLEDTPKINSRLLRKVRGDVHMVARVGKPAHEVPTMA